MDFFHVSYFLVKHPILYHHLQDGDAGANDVDIRIGSFLEDGPPLCRCVRVVGLFG